MLALKYIKIASTHNDINLHDIINLMISFYKIIFFVCLIHMNHTEIKVSQANNFKYLKFVF